MVKKLQNCRLISSQWYIFCLVTLLPNGFLFVDSFVLHILFSWFGVTFQEIHACLVITVLMAHVFRGQKHVLKQLSAGTELIHLLYVVSQVWCCILAKRNGTGTLGFHLQDLSKH